MLLAIAATASGCADRSLTFLKPQNTELQHALEIPAGIVLPIGNDEIACISQPSEDVDSVTVTLVRPDFSIRQTHRIGIPERSRLQGAFPLEGNVMLGYTITAHNGSNFFDAFLLNGADGTRIATQRLNDRSFQQGSSGSVERAPNGSRFAYFNWNYPGPKRLELTVDVYSPSLAKETSAATTVDFNNSYNTILASFLTDAGDPMLVRSEMNDKQQRHLIIQNLRHEDRTMVFPLPKDMAGETVQPIQAAFTQTDNGALYLAVGMADGIYLKGLCTYRLNIGAGTVLAADTLHLTHDMVRSFHHEGNLEHVVPHTILPTPDGGFLLVAEGLNVEFSRGGRVLNDSRGFDIGERDQIEVISEDIAAFRFDSAGRPAWAASPTRNKRETVLDSYVFSWVRSPEYFRHRYLNGFVSYAGLHGSDSLTMLVSENGLLREITLDGRNGTTIAERNLFEMASDDQLRYHEALWQTPDRLIISGQGDDSRNGYLLRIGFRNF